MTARLPVLTLAAALLLAAPTSARKRKVVKFGDQLDEVCAFWTDPLKGSAVRDLEGAEARADQGIGVLREVADSNRKMADKLGAWSGDGSNLNLKRGPALPVAELSRPSVEGFYKKKKRRKRDWSGLAKTLKKRSELIYLVLADSGTLVSAVTLGWEDERWEISSIGRRSLVTSLKTAGSECRGGEAGDEPSFLLRTPGFYQVFLAFCGPGSGKRALELCPLYDDPAPEYKDGSSKWYSRTKRFKANKAISFGKMLDVLGPRAVGEKYQSPFEPGEDN